uniref:TMF_TATA_bd domain-containing protein n=1 Tax=Strongyloides venezuelensis TaxID=75913 RepID=A0A0K0FJN6_STRVS
MNMNFGWASKMAKNALLQAQQKIDQVLEITPEEEEVNSIINDSSSQKDINICNVDEGEEECNEEIKNADEESLLVFTPSNSWHVCHSEGTVVESEPNPSRDEDTPGAVLNLDSSPSTISPNHDSASVIRENINFIKDNGDHDAWESNVSSPDRKNNDHFETETVASSDIEVIKQADEWSSVSGPVHNDNFTIVQNRIDNVLNQVANSSEQVKEMDTIIKNMTIQIDMRDSRINELTRLSKKGESEIGILKQKIKIMEKELKEHNLLKKAKNENEKTISELKEEGMKLSEKLGQKDKEIKKLKAINQENANIKAEFQQVTERANDLTKALDIKNNEIKNIINKYEEESKNDKIEINNLRSEVENLRQSWNSKENMYETRMCDIDDYKTQLEDERKNLKKLKERLKESQYDNEELKSKLQARAEQSVFDNIDLTKAIAEIEDNLKMTIISFENERQQFLDKISELEKISMEREVLYKSLDKRYQTEKLKVEELEIKFEKTRAILKLIPGVLEDFVKRTTIYRTNDIICKKFSHLDNIMSRLQKNFSLLNKKYDLIKERNNAVLNAEQNMGIIMKNENLNKNNMSGVFNTTIIDNNDFINDKSNKSGERPLSPIRIDWYIGGSCENCDNMYKYVSDIKELADASLANKRTILTLQEELKVLREKYAFLEEKETENKVLLDEALQMLGEKIETIEELKQDFIDLEEQYKQTMFDLLQKMSS